MTSFGPEGYKRYGEKFLKSYLEHTDIPLVVYVEDEQKYIKGPEYRSLWDIPYAKEWVESTEDVKDFRWNIHRFVRKALVQIQELKENVGIVCWLDADIVFREDFGPKHFKEKMGDVYCAYLGRQNYHPCTSFVGFNCGLSENEIFLKAYETMYMTGAVLKLPEWHDAYVFGYVLKESGVSSRNLSPWGKPVENVFDKVFTFGHHKKGHLK
jgi:hypothetical protein